MTTNKEHLEKSVVELEKNIENDFPGEWIVAVHLFDTAERDVAPW